MPETKEQDTLLNPIQLPPYFSFIKILAGFGFYESLTYFANNLFLFPIGFVQWAILSLYIKKANLQVSFLFIPILPGNNAGNKRARHLALLLRQRPLLASRGR
jgi:hypothetical protein